MDRLRAAIISDVAEDNAMIGEMTEWHEELVEAFNAAFPDNVITESDIEAMYED